LTTIESTLFFDAFITFSYVETSDFYQLHPEINFCSPCSITYESLLLQHRLVLPPALFVCHSSCIPVGIHVSECHLLFGEK